MSTIDPRLVWLARASVAHILVDAGELELSEAIDRLAHDLATISPCPCHREIVERLERYRPKSYRRAAA